MKEKKKTFYKEKRREKKRVSVIEEIEKEISAKYSVWSPFYISGFEWHSLLLRVLKTPMETVSFMNHAYFFFKVQCEIYILYEIIGEFLNLVPKKNLYSGLYYSK